MKKKKEIVYKKKEYKYSTYTEYMINQIEGVIDLTPRKTRRRKKPII